MGGTNQPDHVSDSAIYDFDLYVDPELLKDPHKRIKELVHKAPPIFWTPRNGGHWLITRYDDAFKVFHDPEIYSSAPYSQEQMQAMMASMPAGAPHIPFLTPILMDPPSHTKYRVPLQQAFAPKAISKLKGEIERRTSALVDAVIEQGHCDFIPAVAEQLSVLVFLDMMGLPSERLAKFRELVREVFAPSVDPNVHGRRMRNVADAMQDIILARSTEPQDDLISRLWAIRIDGLPMTVELMEDYTALLFIAGLDTVINAIGFGMRHLAQHPDFQSELRRNSGLIPDATEELLRRYTFIITSRRVTKDTELRGQLLKAGEKVFICMPANSLDESVFPSPEILDIARANKAHMAFGSGIHTCVGAHLARLEMQTVYRIVLERLPTFRLDPDKSAKFHGGTVFAVASLPLRWD